MTFERIVKQTFEAIQFDGTNLKEVYDFICEHDGNANEVSFEELMNDCSRPKEIPLDVSSSIEAYSMEKNFKEKWKDKIKEWKDYKDDHPYEDMKNHLEIVPEEFLNERRLLTLYEQDWRKGELYHFYISDGDMYCRMVGISKGDWFTTTGNKIDNFSESSFSSYLEDGSWKEAK